jgi:uncharacterized protein YndB with AHSA1/START domain
MAKSSAEALAPSPNLELSITRIFNAPRSLVFKMWAEPEHMDVWSAPNGFTIPAAGMDFRAGGVWHCHMRSPEGTDHRVRGVYREIIPNERLVFTHAWLDAKGKPGHETVVTVTLEDHGRRTKMTFHQGVFETVGSRSGHEGGWTECFGKLDTYLETL